MKFINNEFEIFIQVMRGVGTLKIVIESLDLITIAVPPALPGKILYLLRL